MEAIRLIDIAPAFDGVLQKRKFTVLRAEKDPATFGDAIVHIELVDFALRFLKDRGQLFVDISPLGKADWQDLRYVMEFVDPSQAIRTIDSIPDESEMAHCLDRDYERISSLMRHELDQIGFRRFAKAKASSLMTSIFPKKWNREDNF